LTRNFLEKYVAATNNHFSASTAGIKVSFHEISTSQSKSLHLCSSFDGFISQYVLPHPLMGCVECQWDARGARGARGARDANGGCNIFAMDFFFFSHLRPQRWCISVNIPPFLFFFSWFFISICLAVFFDGLYWVSIECKGLKRG
jgi:hypothetical protein